MELARGGAAVILISSELEEVISLSHRGYLMREGRIIDCVDCRTLGVEDALFRLFNVERGAETGPRTEVRS